VLALFFLTTAIPERAWRYYSHAKRCARYATITKRYSALPNKTILNNTITLLYCTLRSSAITAPRLAAPNHTLQYHTAASLHRTLPLLGGTELHPYRTALDPTLTELYSATPLYKTTPLPYFTAQHCTITPQCITVPNQYKAVPGFIPPLLYHT